MWWHTAKPAFMWNSELVNKTLTAYYKPSNACKFRYFVYNMHIIFLV